MIELQGVTREFKQGSETIQAVKDTDFTAEAGQFIAIIGPSGSGKSTLLTIIGGLQSPTSGKVTIAGEDLSTASKAQLSKMRFSKLGFILQASSLVPFIKVKDQLVLHDKVRGKRPDNARRDHLLESLGVEKLANKYPAQLSGGERQRVAIAAALYHDPKVVLADEPTAALDTERATETVKLLRDLTNGSDRTTIMVTHDERLTKYCDAVYRMEDGTLTRQ
ncbi:MAG: ABC transporter ATP-binding protein [Actinomycetaceae bacterium]|nr:ABC transporter ATP-binding protein [Actinomycetaceae bacterium]